MNILFFQLETLDGTLFPVAVPRCLIGRMACCDVQLPMPEVSRRHAMILRDGHDWWLTDAGSRGGTWLNQVRLTRSERLQAGDRIGIGSLDLLFRPLGEGTALPSPAMDETTLPGDEDWLVTQETAVLWVEPDGAITGGSRDSYTWLAAFFEGKEGALPKAVSDWLASEVAERIPYQQRVGEERLRITVFPMEDGRRLLVLRRLGPAFGMESLRRLGLSRAESELVPWLIRGKRNDEMAAILGRAPKTVEKQVAAILLRLEVETRTAAAWNIIERIGAHH